MFSVEQRGCGINCIYAWLMGHLLLPFGIHIWRSNSGVFNFLTAVGKRHDTHVKYMFPCAVEGQTILRNKGLFCFYKNEPPQFCQMRKVRRPLNRAPRAHILVVQVDLSYEGTDGEVGTGLVKLSSLANIDIQEICNTLLAMNVTLNGVHPQEQKPFECKLCTRLVFPRQHNKDGIGCWCWEGARSENCALHRGCIRLYVHINGTESTTTTKGTGMEDLPYPQDLSAASWLVSFCFTRGCHLFQVMETSTIC